MKKNLLLTCAALAAVSIITSFLLIIPSFISNSQNIPDSKKADERMSDVPIDSKSAQPPKPDYQYLLKDYNGKLAVYLPNKKTPETVFDFYLSALPSYDRGQLQMGVPVESYEELVKRIEDYIS